jgi:chorismate dehydratase
MIRLAAVSYLNARPLVAGLEREPGVSLTTDVPARLLDLLLADRADVALCPVIDYQTSPRDLVIVPGGAIGADGETLTVRLFSRRPLEEIETVHVDSESHTSVALLEILLAERNGRRPRLAPLAADWHRHTPPDALLLIGDKVVASAPTRDTHPEVLDLGRAWRQLTGLPFVFACWMATADRDLGAIGALLAARRMANLERLPELVREALPDGWTEPLARRYLGRLLRYDLGCRQLEAMQLFWDRASALGLLDGIRPLRLHGESEDAGRESA